MRAIGSTGSEVEEKGRLVHSEPEAEGLVQSELDLEHLPFLISDNMMIYYISIGNGLKFQNSELKFKIVCTITVDDFVTISWSKYVFVTISALLMV